MSDKNASGNGNSPGRHLANQLRKARREHGWSIHELSKLSGISAGHLSHLENGGRPLTEAIAVKLDDAFPERKRWFVEYWRDSRSWLPPGFRDWTEIEDRATRLSIWTPNVVHGLAQTPDYARAVLALEPYATDGQIEARLKARMERRRRLFTRDEPASVRFVIDQGALYRLVGNAQVMADEMAHLIELSQRPRVTVQLVPQVGHPATGAELVIADDNAYTESLAGGSVHSDSEMFNRLEAIMDIIAAECYRASESLAMLREAKNKWNNSKLPASVNRATAVQMAAAALALAKQPTLSQFVTRLTCNSVNCGSAAMNGLGLRAKSNQATRHAAAVRLPVGKRIAVCRPGALRACSGPDGGAVRLRRGPGASRDRVNRSVLSFLSALPWLPLRHAFSLHVARRAGVL